MQLIFTSKGRGTLCKAAKARVELRSLILHLGLSCRIVHAPGSAWVSANRHQDALMFELILVTFFITVKKQTPCPGQHIEGMVYLAYGPRRMKVCYGGTVWQQAAGMVDGAEAKGSHAGG